MYKWKDFKWIPISEKEQWPKEKARAIFLDEESGQMNLSWFVKIQNQGQIQPMTDPFKIKKITHFAVIPSLADCEEREKKKQEIIGHIIKMHDEEESISESLRRMDEIKSLLNQL